MGGEMIHPDQRPIERECEPLRKRQPDQQRPGQAWSLRPRDGVDLRKLALRAREGLLTDAPDHLDMNPRGDFRHHAPVGAMELLTGRHDAGGHAPAILTMPMAVSSHDVSMPRILTM